MMRIIATALLLAAVGCAGPAGKEVVPDAELARAAILQEINGYAMASCLAYSSEPRIQREGYGWASVVVQRMEGGIDTLAGVAEAVKAETFKRTPPVIPDEIGPGREIELSVLHCYEIAHQPAVQAIVEEAARRRMNRHLSAE
ncbi:MAG: hypothetical protein ACREPV_00030 [Lysobacter sp.]